MTAQTKDSFKFAIGISTGIVTIIVFAFGLGVGFAKNTSEHEAIKKDLAVAKLIEAEETKRSKETDKITSADIGRIKQDIGVMQSTLDSVKVSIEKIEKKLP